ncbi:Pentatricopeptide repeat-containing protein [Cardamine amara subsp. amara]|uniref:Pentatricopeptide repeat-containing protein n=1 Tax=Cardamine amara subsp. amara TaxID=228776 RepID=A0ABD1APY5_CARAN
MFIFSGLVSKLHGTAKITNQFTIFHRLNHFVTISSSSTSTSLSPQDRNKLLATLLSNCTSLTRVRRIHGDIFRSRILDQYQIPFLWNNIMRSYIRHDSPLDAIHVYLGMVRSNVLPDRYTLPITIKAAFQIHDFPMGKQLHSVAVKLGFVQDEFCESGFITLYCKAGEFENARNVFDENPERKLGSWNAIIGGLNHAARANEAVEMFMEMKRSGFEPDDYTMVSVNSACGGLGNLSLALQLHKCVLQAKQEDKSDIMMMNSLIDMYGKCGCMVLASQVFEEMPQRNVVSWTAMITGYAANGNALEALECFRRMRDFGVRPNKITFVGVLSACVHGGFVEEGKEFFETMKSEFELEPGLSHYGCIVDLLSRNGQLKEAKKVVEEMPMRPNVMVWGCLMGGCEKFGDVEMAEWVAQYMVELEPWNDGVYVVLANVYAVRGMWKDVERVRKMIKEKKLAKIPAFSYPTTTF